MTRSSRDYTAYGLRVRSALALPFLPVPPAGEADVTIRLGPTPQALSAPAEKRMLKALGNGSLWEVARDAMLLNIEGLARYLVTDGRDITIQLHGGSDHDVSLLLTGTVLTALLQQRGLVTFHASAIATETGAVLFMGPSGGGKSSLLAALIERGFIMLSDDVTAVEVGAAEKPRGLPAFPCTRLWADALDALEWKDRPQEHVREGVEKYLVPVERFHPTPLPLRAVYTLTSENRQDVRIEQVPAAQVFRWLYKRTYRKRLLHGMGQQATHFRTLTAIVQGVPVFRVIRPRNPFLLDALADRIKAHLREEPPFVREDATAGQAESAAIAGG